MRARKNLIASVADPVDFTIYTLFEANGWRSESLCSQLPIDEADAMFFPERGRSTKAAKAICSRCPVQAECLEFSLEDPDAFYFGIWGGTSQLERKKLRRQGIITAA